MKQLKKQRSVNFEGIGRALEVCYGVFGYGESLNDFDVEVFAVYKADNGDGKRRRNLLSRMTEQEVTHLAKQALEHEMNMVG